MDRQIQVKTEPGLWPPTWPMGLTMLRLLLLPVFLWGILIDANESPRTYWWVSVVVFFIMAVTDKLDGYLARRLGQTSKLGAVLDPLADKLLVACAVILLSFEWIAPEHFRIPWWVVVAVYGKDLIVAAGTIAILSVVGKVSVSPRPLGKISTMFQLSMVMAVLLAPADGAWWFAAWRIFVTSLWWAVCALAAASCVDYVTQGIIQYRRERAVNRSAAGAPTGGSGAQG